jgi:hypothetical protein
MAYHLVQRFGRKDKPQYRKEALGSFPTEKEAVKMACVLLDADNSSDFLIEDDKGNIVINDAEIRTLCSEIVAR